MKNIGIIADGGESEPEVDGGMMINECDDGAIELHIKGAIHGPELYTKEFAYLRAYAKTNKVLRVFINSPGGHMVTAVELMSILDEFETVITIGAGQVMSAGFILWARGDVRMLVPYTSLMVHRENYTNRGYTKDHLDLASHTETMFREMFQEFIDEGFLTDEEYDRSRNSNVYFSAKEIVERGVAVYYTPPTARAMESVSLEIHRVAKYGELVLKIEDGSESMCRIINEDVDDELKEGVLNIYQLVYYGIDTIDKVKSMLYTNEQF